jgi:hypothetical protein
MKAISFEGEAAWAVLLALEWIEMVTDSFFLIKLQGIESRCTIP